MISTEGSQYAHNFIKRIVDAVGPRLPGSAAERKGAELIAEEFTKVSGSKAILEEFLVRPLCAIGAIPILGYIIALSPILFLIFPIGAIIAVAFALIFAVLQVFTYSNVLSFLFPKKLSQNVYSIIEPASGQTDYTIVFAGHMDSSWNWNLALKKPTLMWVKLPYGVLGGVVTLILALFKVLGQNQIISWWSDWYGLLIIPFIPGFWFVCNFLSYDIKKASPGAMDDLSGVAANLQIVRDLKAHPDRIPKNCRIILLGTGSEEAGIFGSKEFAERHENDLLKNSWVICVDGVSDFEHFHIIDGDTWLFTKYDEDLCQMSAQSMKEVGVIPGTRQKNPVGGTDGGSFCRKGIRTVTLLAQNPIASDYYHTKNDRPERLDIRAMDKMNEVLALLIKKIDLHEKNTK